MIPDETVSVIVPGSASDNRSTSAMAIVFPSFPSVAVAATGAPVSASATAPAVTLVGASASEKTIWIGSVSDTLLAPESGDFDTIVGGVLSTTIVTGALATVSPPAVVCATSW